MSTEKITKLDPIIRDSLESYDINQMKYNKIINKIKFIEFKNNENVLDQDYIIFYDKNYNKIHESSYQIFGIYMPQTQMWKWSWAIPSILKKHTYISRKILEYAFDLDVSQYILKSELINSKIKIENDLQLDIHTALSSYIAKQPFVFKWYNRYSNGEEENEDEDESSNNESSNDNTSNDSTSNDSTSNDTIDANTSDLSKKEKNNLHLIPYNQLDEDLSKFMIIYLFIIDNDIKD